MSLERTLEYTDIDDYVEATPKSLCLRKRILSATTRKRAANLNYTICHRAEF
jgi:GTP-binding protein